MKKSIINIAFALILSAILCGCGTTADTDRPQATAVPAPTATVSPMATPDITDGEVTDEDGIVGDIDTNTPNVKESDNAAKATPKASVSPKATDKA